MTEKVEQKWTMLHEKRFIDGLGTWTDRDLPNSEKRRLIYRYTRALEWRTKWGDRIEKEAILEYCKNARRRL